LISRWWKSCFIGGKGLEFKNSAKKKKKKPLSIRKFIEEGKSGVVRGDPIQVYRSYMKSGEKKKDSGGGPMSSGNGQILEWISLFVGGFIENLEVLSGNVHEGKRGITSGTGGLPFA